MKFEEALKAMREGKKVKKRNFKGRYYIKDNALYFFDDEHSIERASGITEEAIFSNDWEIVDGEDYSILKSVEENSEKLKKKCEYWQNNCEYWQNKYNKALHKQIEVEKELESVRAEAVTLKKELDVYQGKYYVFGKLSPEEEREFNIKLSKCEATLEDKKAPDKIDIKITFIGGGEIVIPDEQWDDYRYDGKFFTIIKDGADIAMYNAKNVYSLVLVRQGNE